MDETAAAACARAALAGNPSDGYGGAVLAVTLEPLRAEAEARRETDPVVDPPSELVRAAISRFARDFEPAARTAAVRWRTSIPRGVGLGGSSAIVISVLRSLCAVYEVGLDPALLASVALAVEVEDLGIAAGLQDRVVQAYGGLVFMEFSGEGRYERLDPDLLPPLVIGWRPDAAQESGSVHARLGARFNAGERAVVDGMAELAELARTARAALLARNRGRFSHAVDSSFAVRRRLLELDPQHVEMVNTARSLGAGANYTGSGGAVVAVCVDSLHAEGVRQALAELGCGTLTR
jgi:glucuronokinase